MRPVAQIKLSALLGWRNLWRNPRRSLITIAALAAAYASLIGLIGLFSGLQDQLLNNGTLHLLGHLQIHAGAYLPDRNLLDTVGGDDGTDVEALLDSVQGRPEVLAAAPRVLAFGLLSTGENSTGARLMGVDPGRESSVTQFLGGLQRGTLPSPGGSRDIVLGRELARELEAELGSEVALVTQAADGTMGNDLYFVSGILSSGLRHLDRSLAVVYWNDLQDLLVLGPGQIHEVAIRLENPLGADALVADLNRSGRLPPETQARSWGDLSPQLKDYMSLADGADTFLIFLVALFASLGVLNTMMMAVFERTREMGMLNALGTRPLIVFASFMFESLSLALLGLGVGLAGGAAIIAYLSIHGWDLTRWTGEIAIVEARIDPILRGSWQWDQVFWSAVGLLIATLAATLIPTRRALRLDPVKALAAPTEG